MDSNQEVKEKNTCTNDKSKINNYSGGILPMPDELIAMLDRKIVGQNEAKETIAVAAYNHFLMCALSDLSNWSVEPTSILLIGPTGSGKSYLLKTLRECLKVPMIYLSCTGLTQNGYKGVNINEVIDRLEEEFLDDERTQPAIVVWDEVDKIREIPNQHSVSSRGVQQDLLTFLDGTRCGRAGKLDSTRFLNVACGAFVGLEEIRRKQEKSPRIGFSTESNEEGASEDLHPLTTQHLIDYGLIPEFVGRFSSVAELTPLDAETLRNILTNAEDNPLHAKKILFKIHGVELIITDDALDEIIARAAVMGIGARSLKRVLQGTLGRYEYLLPELATQGVSALTITAETVRGGSALQNFATNPEELCQLATLRKHAGSYALWKKRPKQEVVW